MHAPPVREWISQNDSYYTGSAPLMDSTMVFSDSRPGPGDPHFYFYTLIFEYLQHHLLFSVGLWCVPESDTPRQDKHQRSSQVRYQ
jgi:hypothetical protein